MNTRRLYGPVVLGTLAAGGLAFLGASRRWATVTLTTEGLPQDTVHVTGSDAQPLVPALALVTITAALAVLASSPRVRRGVGVLTVVVAVLGIVLVLVGGTGLDDAVDSAVKQSPAFTGGPVPAEHHTVWRLVTAVAFVLAGVLGATTARFGHRWPTMGSRYEAPAARPTPADPQSESDIWKALDEGRDPTQ